MPLSPRSVRTATAVSLPSRSAFSRFNRIHSSRAASALRNEPSDHYEVVLTNPPFGKKSSITVVNEEGETDKQSVSYSRAGLLDHDQQQAA